MKRLSILSIMGYAIMVIAFLYVLTGIAVAILGTNEVFGFLSAIYSQPDGYTLASVTVLGAVAKGAEKLTRNGLIVFEETTKKGKTALCILFDKTEKGLQNLDHFKDLCLLSGNGFFVWPSKNPDKEKYMAVGVPNNTYSLKLIDSYNKMTFKNAKEMEAEKIADKAKAREAKKANKEANKNGGSLVLAKIQAIKDMNITELEKANLIMQLA